MTYFAPLTEFDPLLTPGLHIFSLADLRHLCVDPFPHSATRSSIMTGLESVVAQVSIAGICADIWVNGSFLTQKENPSDSDIVVKVDATIIDNGTNEQKATLNWVGSNLKNDYLCDSYLLPIYPDGDPQYVLNDYQIAYWLRQFGFSRGVEYKGIAVVQITGVS